MSCGLPWATLHKNQQYGGATKHAMIRDLTQYHSKCAMLVVSVWLAREHPVSKTAVLAMCGRLRHSLSDKRPISIYFAIERCSEAKLANLSYKYVKCNTTISLNLNDDATTIVEDRCPHPFLPSIHASKGACVPLVGRDLLCCRAPLMNYVCKCAWAGALPKYIIAQYWCCFAE